MVNTVENSLSLLPQEATRVIPNIEEHSEGSGDSIIYAHLFGVIGDWYISEISSDLERAYGYQFIQAESVWEMDDWFNNSQSWGYFSIKELQNLINEKFLKEKDICFLIVRDIYWKPKKFSEINIEKTTLRYPGVSSRIHS